jgi:predicted MFS family arabinose efflux permease
MDDGGNAAAPDVAAPSVGITRGAGYTLFVLMLVYSCNVMDRNVLTMVLEPIRQEFALSDGQLGLLSGLAFAIFYAVAGLPLGAAADRVNRRNMIFVCLTLWSAMTALSGMAGNFLQLLAARIGVGIGEAGGGPPAMAMISDLYPARRRATAISAFYLASPVGAMISFAGGGWVAQHYGWRMAFLAAAVPGLALAAVLILTVREPMRGQMERRHAEGHTDLAAAPTVGDTLRFVLSQPSLIHMIIATTLTVFVVSGIGTWSASFFIRTHGFSPAGIGETMAAVTATTGLAGTLAGGLIVDRLGRGDNRRRCWTLAAATALTMPLIAAWVLLPRGPAIGFYAAYILASFIWYGPVHGLCQSLVTVRMRATISAIVNLVSNLVGVGLGSQAIGLLSDRLAPKLGGQSLRYAMLAAALVSLWAAVHFLLAARTVREDLKRVQLGSGGNL